jgi:hypothetical protein
MIPENGSIRSIGIKSNTSSEACQIYRFTLTEVIETLELNASQIVDSRSASVAVLLNALGVVVPRLRNPPLLEQADSNETSAKTNPICAMRM